MTFGTILDIRLHLDSASSEKIFDHCASSTSRVPDSSLVIYERVNVGGKILVSDARIGPAGLPELTEGRTSRDIDSTISPLKEASDAAFNESETVWYEMRWILKISVNLDKAKALLTLLINVSLLNSLS